MAEKEDEEKIKGKDEITGFCNDWIKKIRDGRGEIDKNWEDARKFYEADPSIVKFIDERAKLTTNDMKNKIKAVKPDLLELFAGGDEVVKFDPANEKSVQGTKNLTLLVNQQVRQKNPWFLLMNDFVEDLLQLKFGVFKIRWFKSKEILESKSYESVPQELFDLLTNSPDIEISEHKETEIQPESIDELTGMPIPAIKTHSFWMDKFTEDEFPKIELIPPKFAGFPLYVADLADSPFFYHEVHLTKWKFIEKYGKKNFDKIKKLKDTFDDEKSAANIADNFKDLGGRDFIYNDKEDLFIAWECYYPHFKTGRKWLTIIAGNEILFDGRNRTVTFQGATPDKLAHRFVGESFYDWVKDIQVARTSILRAVFDSTLQSIHRRYFVDYSRLNMDDYLNNNSTNAAIRTEGPPGDIVLPEQKASLPPEVFNLFEALNQESDQESIARSYVGVDKGVLHKTFRGQSQQIQQSSKPVLMIGRLIAEMCVVPMMKDIVKLNLANFKTPQLIRYLGSDVMITKDNIACQIDYKVNVGLGVGTKAETIGNLQQAIQLSGQMMKTGHGIFSAENEYNLAKELYHAMGFLNHGDFITDPKIPQLIMGIVQKLQEIAMQTGMQDPQLMQMLMQLMKAHGVMPPPQPNNPQEQGGNGAKGTFPGQNMPARPVQPGNPMNPFMPSVGGGHFG